MVQRGKGFCVMRDKVLALQENVFSLGILAGIGSGSFFQAWAFIKHHWIHAIRLTCGSPHWKAL